MDVAEGVTQEGKYLVRYRGPEVSAEVEYRLAKYTLGDQWLVFKLSLASEGDTVRVARDAVRVRAPGGQTLTVSPPLRFVTALSEDRPEVSFGDLPSASAEGTAASPALAWVMKVVPPSKKKRMEKGCTSSSAASLRRFQLMA